MEIQLINLGRNNVNKTVTVKNENEMWREIKKHLLSKDIELTETDEPNKYTVWAGMRNVGELIIKN